MNSNLPTHIAIIMDGNGRWAKKRFLPKIAGHRAGAQALRKLVDKADAQGLKHLTVYAFSTENWKRSDKEISDLMNLIREFIKDFLKNGNNTNVKMDTIGDLSKLDQDIQDNIEHLKQTTIENTGLCLHIALNYGGRDEITRAVKNICEEYKNNKIDLNEITENLFNNYLDSKDYPDPELIIRTSNEQRLSNFLIWQSAYSELYFSDKLWPDFSYNDLMVAINEYNNRDRRYGGRNEEN